MLGRDKVSFVWVHRVTSHRLLFARFTARRIEKTVFPNAENMHSLKPVYHIDTDLTSVAASTPVSATTVETLDHLELLGDPDAVLETLDVAGLSAQGPVH